MSTLKPQNTRALARGAIIAALYTALTVLLAPLSYGEVQIRFSEAFTLLPILMPEAVPALLVGCLLSNILGGCTIFDIVFGSLATLLAAVCTRRLRDKFWLAALMPVLFNGVIECRRCRALLLFPGDCPAAVHARRRRRRGRRVSGRRPAAHQRAAPHARFRAELNSFSS